MFSFLPTGPAFLEAVCAVLVFLAWCVVGAAAGGRNRCRNLDPLVGWAILCVPYLCLGTLTQLSFLAIDAGCFVLIAGALAVCRLRKIDLELAGWMPYLALVLPFVLVVAPTGAYGWDQISHWIPNADYIAAHQHFPGKGYPPSTSMHAGYPYGFALPLYWVNMLMRQLGATALPVGTAAVFNVLLLVVAARMLVDKVRTLGPVDAEPDSSTLGALVFAKDPWLAAGFALLCVTALSPTFLPTNSISGTADNPTAVALLAIALSILPESDTKGSEVPLIQLASLLVLTVYLKEDNAIPALALLTGRIVWDVRSAGSQGRRLRTLGMFALASIPMLAAAALWHGYAYAQIPQGEMALRPPAEWRPDLLPRVLAGMAVLLAQKIGYFLCLLPVLFFGARALFRRAAGRYDAGAFAVIAASAFVGYTLFLAVAYISVFDPGEAERQAAFWRYETHLGLVLEASVLLLLCGFKDRKRLFYARLGVPVAALMLLAPIIMAPMIRPDLDPQTIAISAIAHDVDARVGAVASFGVADQFGNGAPCPMFVYLAKTPLRVPECATKITPCKECKIREAVAHEPFIWTNGWSPELARATGLQLPPNASYLLARTATGWRTVAHWPKTPTKMHGIRAIWQVS